MLTTPAGKVTDCGGGWPSGGQRGEGVATAMNDSSDSVLTHAVFDTPARVLHARAAVAATDSPGVT